MITSERPETAEPDDKQIRQWRKNLAEERAEFEIYRRLGKTRTGEEREILLELAEAEKRHAEHWETLLGDRVGRPLMPSFRTLVLGFLARWFGFVFALALIQVSEERATKNRFDNGGTPAMVADEAVHAEVIRALATRGRNSMSGTFRAAVFGANDGLVSNLALVLGVAAANVSNSTVLLTGVSGLLAGALSMGAGEWVSVRSQRELLEASNPAESSNELLPSLDVNENELSLVYRARGMDVVESQERARTALKKIHAQESVNALQVQGGDFEEIGSPWRAAISSFFFFAAGAIIPIVPFMFTSGITAILISTVLVGIALLFTGGIVGILSGKAPGPRALRQLLIGYGAGIITFALGLLFGTTA
ncbi:VIT1/CCC1 transporter family protein [Flaviflexus massiliensis]|uniref:VIT1/CCC1 transporter family protein n=1 Tax=Flaviflexus massiliensis TaxID=1522309 RepID=UPI0028FCE407|nr:VIT1/CCC1 transporter family protein [Flaviflexus massiliensis]